MDTDFDIIIDTDTDRGTDRDRDTDTDADVAPLEHKLDESRSVVLFTATVPILRKAHSLQMAQMHLLNK